MRAVLIGGILLLLLTLTMAALVALRRSRDAVARPASSFSARAGVAGERAAPAGGPEGTEPDASDGGLVLDPAEVDLGMLEARETRQQEVSWKRTGDGDLRIRSVRTGCGCAVATGLPDVLREGSSGALSVEFRGRSTPGPFTVFVHVLTDRPPGDVKRVRIRGFIGSAIQVAPAILRLGAVSPGRVVERTATVRPPPAQRHLAVRATLVEVAGSASVERPGESGAVGHDIVLTIHAPEAPGPFTGMLVIEAGTDSLWRIPITGTVVPPAAEGGTR